MIFFLFFFFENKDFGIDGVFFSNKEKCANAQRKSLLLITAAESCRLIRSKRYVYLYKTWFVIDAS
jgi:hypothetical protein